MTGRQYADDPLDDLGADLLERGRLAVRLANVLKAVTEQTDSAVAALVGPWGSGKTTLLVRIEQLLAAEAQWHVAHYNPWVYSSLDAAVAGFFDELRTALPEDALGTDRRGAVGRLAQRMAPFGALGGAIGIECRSLLRNSGGSLAATRAGGAPQPRSG